MHWMVYWRSRVKMRSNIRLWQSHAVATTAVVIDMTALTAAPTAA